MDTLLDRAAARLSRLPIFAAADYAVLNADVAQAGTDLARHALLHGCAEKRQIFKHDRLARSWGEALLRTSNAPAAEECPTTARPLSASVFVNSWSAPAIKDLAELLERDLLAQGVAATVETERAMPDAISDAAIVIAPQDFFRLGLGPAWRKTALPRSALMLNTTAVTSEDFASALPFLLAGRGILDLSPQIADIFAQADVPAAQIRPSMPLRKTWLEAEDAEHPLVHALPMEARQPEAGAGDPRLIDVSFVGAHTPWRGECLARIAPELAAYRTFFPLRSSEADLVERGVLDRTLFRIAGHVSARSKVALHLTRSGFPCVDWLAVFQSMAAGAVVVTDHAAPHPEFRAGTHLFQDDSRHLPDLVRWLLNDAEGRAAGEAARSLSQSIIAHSSSSKTWTSQAARLWSAT